MAEYSGRELLAMSVVSFVVYLLLALGIFHLFHEGTVAGAFDHGFGFPAQLAAGCLAGCLAAGAIVFLASRPPLCGVLDDFYLVRIISRTRFTRFDRIQLSLFAGTGEELLFRGAIQPLLGIWFTSVMFIGLHGYFKFRSSGHLLFGVLMFALSLLLGFLFEYAGLIAAMSAHAIYDLILLWRIQANNGRPV